MSGLVKIVWIIQNMNRGNHIILDPSEKFEELKVHVMTLDYILLPLPSVISGLAGLFV